MKSLLIFAVIAALCLPAHAAEPDYPNIGPWQCGEITNPTDTPKPNLLVIGDSISVGYTPVLQSVLAEYDVFHSPCNAAYSGYTALHIDDWLDDNVWDVIVFNNGIWDLNTEGVPLTSYGSYMTTIADKVQAAAPLVIFVSTSKHPQPYFDFVANPPIPRAILMRQMAEYIMTSRGIPINRLGEAGDALEGFKTPDLVHYYQDGYELIGKAIAGTVRLHD